MCLINKDESKENEINFIKATMQRYEDKKYFLSKKLFKLENKIQ
jgi:hypothetical protein